ncbi:asparagine synthase (glutamine-hydrolyzing) [Mariprofundus erugo]|uniref:asparagine synthase (glutamine-hydrolyzing) n=1 Tax=Mariprofundus erugo TaxID=2528639 RepID=UPI0010FE11F1|nr:asparagine synthase (glutamine-hydrolyzing) [Mariprofundus erugo]TLS78406.1 asparagine synthase (glutamine-hydrolyzing) [Mariprofundus erugo]
MCGIYGKVWLDKKADTEDGQRRTQALNHRGPDYCGMYSDKNVFLGHARLSIQDLTEAGNQPFGDGESKLIFNGEIYNWHEIYSQYLSDQPLHTHSDTEVLYLLLKKMGANCLPLLDGMFAFAYYTKSTRQLILARDMTGIKPLNFVPGLLGFEFSSEIKNLELAPDLNRLKEFFYFGRFGEDFLPYENLNEVLPGSYVILDCESNQWSQQPYREAESLVDSATYNRLLTSDDLVDQLDSLLQRSVAMHEQSDAPIGFLCSGGLDSSLITAIAAKRHGNMALYHADFEGEGRELEYAERVAKHVGAPLHKTTLSKKEFWQYFPEMTYSMDLPIQHPHSVSLNLISKKVRADGVKVLLAGDGADELFLGYPFYSSYANSLSNFRSAGDFKTLIRKIVNVIRRAVNPISNSYWYFCDIDRGFQKHAHVGFGGDASSFLPPFQAMSLVSQDFKAWKRWSQATNAYDWMKDGREASVLGFQLFYLRYFLQPLLHRLDRMLMETSVEGRVPFLENELIRFALNLPVDKKINHDGGKYLLKQVALRYLPEDIVNRRKKGFTVPFKNYVTKYPDILDGGFVSDWAHLTRKELVSWCNGDVDMLYRLISIEVWGRIFVHKTHWSEINIDL